MNERRFRCTLPEGDCVEIILGNGPRQGALVGYAIKWGGQWDAWEVTSMNTAASVMRRVKSTAVFEEALVALGVVPDPPRK
jgi:hypothetical protein